MSENKIDSFFSLLAYNILRNQFIKLTLSDRRDKGNELKNVLVKPVLLKSGFQISLVYRYPTKDITKNYPVEDSIQLLREMIKTDFMKADMFTTQNSYHLTQTKEGKVLMSTKLSSTQISPSAEHDRTKKRYIIPENNIYLRALGVTSAEGKVRSDKQDKFRQINKYVEIVAGEIDSASIQSSCRIADMGSGKGYLTFALYDYLTNVLALQPEIQGVEMRQELVDQCNLVAADAGFSRLIFRAGSITDTEFTGIDILIALHACDTATDQALFKGIRAGAKIIICAPCCHKQIRKQIQPSNILNAINRYGILEERQAEILTDTMRALILEAYGYKTKVFEFISTEHTPKNVMIVGIKSDIEASAQHQKLQELKSLKDLFGIEYHELEKLLQI